MKLILKIMLPFIFITNIVKAQVVDHKRGLEEITSEKIVKPPFNQIVRQKITRRKFLLFKRNALSTGFFINKNFILTAGHNLKSNLFSKVKTIDINFGQHKKDSTYNIIIGKNKKIGNYYRVCKDFHFFLNSENRRVKYDFAIIYVPDDLIPENLKFKKEFIFPTKQLEYNSEVVYLSGYPAKEFKELDYFKGDVMYFQKGDSINMLNQSSYKHWMNTYGGNSGSPVWIERDGLRHLIGIHTYNSMGTFLSDKNINEIMILIDELKALHDD